MLAAFNRSSVPIQKEHHMYRYEKYFKNANINSTCVFCLFRMALFTAQMIVLSVLILAWPAMCQEPSYLNEFADVVDFNCSSGSAVARILSNALFNDRQWNFECVEVR